MFFASAMQDEIYFLSELRTVGYAKANTNIAYGEAKKQGFFGFRAHQSSLMRKFRNLSAWRAAWNMERRPGMEELLNSPEALREKPCTRRPTVVVSKHGSKRLDESHDGRSWWWHA
jgi:hypothetical protein